MVTVLHFHQLELEDGLALFSLVPYPNLFSRHGSGVASVSVSLKRLANIGIKVAPIRARQEPSVCPASRGEAVRANAVGAPGVHVLNDVVDVDGGAIPAHEVRLRCAGIGARGYAAVRAPNTGVLLHGVISLALALN